MRIAESIADVHYITNPAGDRTDVIVPLSAWEALLAVLEEMADHLRRIKECTDHAEDVAGALATAEKRAKEAQDALTEYRRTEILPRYEMRLGALERELTKAAARVAVARGTVIGLSPFRITVEDYVRRSRHNAESYALVVDQVEKELTAELER